MYYDKIENRMLWNQGMRTIMTPAMVEELRLLRQGQLSVAPTNLGM